MSVTSSNAPLSFAKTCSSSRNYCHHVRLGGMSDESVNLKYPGGTSFITIAYRKLFFEPREISFEALNHSN
jgi:hypothetical protein